MPPVFTIRNTDGVEIFDLSHRCLRIVASGTTASLATAQAVVDASYAAISGGKKKVGLLAPVGTHIAHDGLALRYHGQMPPPNAGIAVYVVEPVFDAGAEGGWSAFYQWTAEPIYGSLETEFDLAELAQGTFCAVTGERPYRLSAPIPTPGGYDTQWGLRIRSSAGEVLFDSRDTFLPVRFAFIVPIAVAQDILANNTSRDIALPEAMPSSWVSLPYLHCIEVEFLYLYALGSTTRRVWRENHIQIQQIDDTTIRVSRRTGAIQEDVWSTGNTPPPRAFYSYAHDIIVYLARNIGGV